MSLFLSTVNLNATYIFSLKVLFFATQDNTLINVNNVVSRPFIRDIQYRVLQTIQMKLRLLWVWAERAVLGRAKTALKFKYEIQVG